MLNSTLPCPVPPEQQPLNEYQELRDSWFFAWAIQKRGRYWRTALWIWGLSTLLSAPVAAASFSPVKQPLAFGLSAFLGASLPLVFALLQLYLGWRYVADRLRSATVVYEESGWYDGQTWEKPLEVLARDQLIVTHQINPVLQRLHQTLGILALLWLGSGVGLYWVR